MSSRAPTSPPVVRRETRFGLGLVAATVAVLLGVAVVGGDLTARSGDGPDDGDGRRSASAAAPDDADDTGAGAPGGDPADLAGPGPSEADLTAPTDTEEADLVDLVDLTEPEAGDLGDCRIEANSLRAGDEGQDVRCLQAALVDAAVFDGPVNGVFGPSTHDAVVALQTERNLFVDGVAGRETALSLDIWRDEESNVVRTPPPPPGAVDLLGYPLSSVATSGPDAPPLPADSGTGKRLVYERAGQRVWAVDDSETVIRSWLVTGSMYNNELPGTHYVYSRSIESTAWNGEARLPKMVRWLETERGHIGFHGIPTRMDNGEPYQTDDELGTRLSGGCQRQADLDADFVWDFAPEGTKVVVL